MNKKEKKERLSLICDRLKEIYPNPVCALEYGGDPWRLLIMARLSAQCTDARVNAVCKRLFARFPNARALAEGEIEEIEQIIKPCGLYHVKAENIRAASWMLVKEYCGTVPDSMEELLRFPGVGRKVANLVLGDIYGRDVVVCDTHCMRISARLGMYPESLNNPDKIEKIMLELMPKGEGSDYCHRIVEFGRQYCPARGFKCGECPLSDLCEHNLSGKK